MESAKDTALAEDLHERPSAIPETIHYHGTG